MGGGSTHKMGAFGKMFEPTGEIEVQFSKFAWKIVFERGMEFLPASECLV